MKNLILLLIIFIIIVFNNCEISKDEYYFLKESNRSSLKSGDTLIYYDNNNQSDTLFVYNRIKGVIKEPLTGSCKAPYSYYDIDLVYFIKKRNSTNDLLIPTCEYLKDRKTFGSCWSGYECDKTIYIAIIAHENNLNIEFPYLYWYGYIIGKADTLMASYQVSEKKYENVFYF
ncbi:MAG: hypothetical protein N2662_03175, partial [Bacteroidales bacterium]|nr:hypothetical protein [Bacteroidales bacterium]